MTIHQILKLDDNRGDELLLAGDRFIVRHSKNKTPIYLKDERGQGKGKIEERKGA